MQGDLKICFDVRKRPDLPCESWYTGDVLLEDEVCYQAIKAKDPRFDGCFFVAVKSTGIYCRPICPARLPARKGCSYFSRAAEAESAGYRACFRCRPELAPGDSSVDSKSRLVRLASRRIAEGYLNQGTVESLASECGISSRHLRRAMEDELGVAPVELAQTQRLAIAKRLLQDTELPLAEVATAAGFGSIRRFNALFKERFSRAPSEVRGRRGAKEKCASIQVRLDYRPPLDFSSLLRYLSARAIPGVEVVDAERYGRSVHVDGVDGEIWVEQESKRHALRASVSLSLVPKLSLIVPRLRALFDLDARPSIVDQRLAADPLLRKAVRARPGIRVLGAFDGFELGVRAILGQQVSVRAATTVSGRFASRFGRQSSNQGQGPALFFPNASQIAELKASEVQSLGMPSARAKTVIAFARALDGGFVDFTDGEDAEAVVRKLQDVPGIGAWTAEYIAMRALKWPNAFPAGDLALRKALRVKSAKQAASHARKWEPWRAYGAMHLWTMLSHGD